MKAYRLEIVALLVAFLVAAAAITGISYYLYGNPFEEDGAHHGSPAYTEANSRDHSLLGSHNGTPDRMLWACNATNDGVALTARAYDNGNMVGSVTDHWDSSGACSKKDLGRNAAAHDACRGEPGNLRLCGNKSLHGS